MSNPATNDQEERKDLSRRQELQSQLQDAIRRSASSSEIKRIQNEIEALNKKIDSRETHLKRA